MICRTRRHNVEENERMFSNAIIFLRSKVIAKWPTSLCNAWNILYIIYIVKNAMYGSRYLKYREQEAI